MRNNYFSLAIDVSNDIELEKLNPLTVRLFDVYKNKVVKELLDMCITKEPDAGKAEEIFNKINECLEKYKIPWAKCKGYS